MLIRSIIERQHGTRITLDSTQYAFLPKKEGGEHVCEVEDKTHIKKLLSISEGYEPAEIELKSKKTKPSKKTEADEGSAGSEGGGAGGEEGGPSEPVDTIVTGDATEAVTDAGDSKTTPA